MTSYELNFNFYWGI